MQVVERRLEQAAEESRKAGRSNERVSGFAGYRRSIIVAAIVIPALRE